MATNPKTDSTQLAALEAAIQSAKDEALPLLQPAPMQSMSDEEYERYLDERAKEEAEMDRLYQEALKDDPDLANFRLSQAILDDRGPL